MIKVYRIKPEARTLAGQSVLEFSFAIFVFVLLAYGMVAIVRWGYRELGHNRKAHDVYFESGHVSSLSINRYDFTNAENSVGPIFK